VDGVTDDRALAAAGERKIAWAERWMPVTRRVAQELDGDGTLRGRRVAVILPLEPKTACFASMLAEVGAEVSLAFQGSMVHDDVAAGLAARGVAVFARRGSTRDEEVGFFERVLDRRPEVVIDDRADVVRLAHTTHRGVLDGLVGACEQTTSGVVALRAMEADGTLEVPVIASNDARCKHLFDNRYGTGQSAVAAVLDATNLLLAGKTFVVVGYGWVGKGIARRARGLNARVVVCEVDAFAALEAYHDGFEVMTVREACVKADVVMTATGCRDALPLTAIEELPDGAILANAGGIDDEFDVAALRERAAEIRDARPPHVREYVLEPGRSVYVVGDGVVVNLSAGEGHGAEIIDLSFGVQALAARHLLLHGADLEPGVHLLPAEIDERLARWKLESLGIRIDRLSPAQEAFLRGWEPF
jgi:adenosylhomocysteinase